VLISKGIYRKFFDVKQDEVSMSDATTQYYSFFLSA